MASTSEQVPAPRFRPAAGTRPGASDSPVPGAPSRHNGFGLLRLILASLVVVQHALALTGHEDRTFLGWWHGVSIGELAVAGFFGLSGHLLAASAERHPPRRFLRLRFFRLFPGFWATLAVVALGIAPLTAWLTGQWSDYRLLGAGSATSYLVLNAGLVVFQHGVGDLLATNPWPTAWDGSLWSLAPEFACYLALLTAFVVARRLRLSPLLPVLLLWSGSLLLLVASGPVLGEQRAVYPSLLGSLGLAFFSGTALHRLGWLQRPDPRRAAAVTAATAVVIATGLWVPFGPPLLAATVVGVGRSITSGWATAVDRRADLSYGMYLYHFPVIQALIATGATGLGTAAALGWLTPVTVLLTAVLAAGSWFAVEAPAQRFGRRRRAAGPASSTGTSTVSTGPSTGVSTNSTAAARSTAPGSAGKPPAGGLDS